MKMSKLSIEDQLRWIMMASPLVELRNDLDAHNYQKLDFDRKRLDDLTHNIDRLTYIIKVKHWNHN